MRYEEKSKKVHKNLVMSEKSSNFAPAFGKTRVCVLWNTVKKLGLTIEKSGCWKSASYEENAKNFLKNLAMSKKSSTFAPAFAKNEAFGLWKIVNTRCSTRTGNDI